MKGIIFEKRYFISCTLRVINRHVKYSLFINFGSLWHLFRISIITSFFFFFLFFCEEMVLKFSRGTGNLSRDELQDFLGQNDIDDSLGDFYEFTTRLLRIQGVDHCCHVHYSLKKRKRWQLAEKVKRMEDTKETAPNATFIHRRVDRKRAADCFEVVRAKAGEVLQPRKRKYARAQDLLKRSEKAELEPEVCYEMRYRTRYPRNEYP